MHRVTMEETIEAIDRFIREGGPHHVVTLDSSMCVMAERDSELRRIVDCAELVTPDSAGILWACRRMGRPLPERVSGVEIVERLCAASAEKGYRLYFLGAAPGVAENAAARMRARYPGCRIIGTRDGYFREGEEIAVVHEIAAARPDILCVAMGIPKQEKWIARHRAALGVPVLIGVGGTFDVFSGKVKRAPHWMQRLSLEWLYRFARNPRKIRKVMTLPRFVWMTLRARNQAALSTNPQP
ncbi:MAG TPA: WecB/TagA/CpsF family glycosyltransferase [Chthonomonadales bacterium]|nr:WecB/TagA/CpsF family glycosyltransferase [Chthonomonadales bacterium]